MPRSGAGCPHLLHRAVNPRICYGTDNARRLVYDCGDCGERDVVDTEPAAYRRQRRADVVHGHGGSRQAVRVDGMGSIMGPRG